MLWKSDSFHFYNAREVTFEYSALDESCCRDRQTWVEAGVLGRHWVELSPPPHWQMTQVRPGSEPQQRPGYSRDLQKTRARPDRMPGRVKPMHVSFLPESFLPQSPLPGLPLQLRTSCLCTSPSILPSVVLTESLFLPHYQKPLQSTQVASAYQTTLDSLGVTILRGLNKRSHLILTTTKQWILFLLPSFSKWGNWSLKKVHISSKLTNPDASVLLCDSASLWLSSTKYSDNVAEEFNFRW